MLVSLSASLAFAQSGNSTISGSVRDVSEGAIAQAVNRQMLAGLPLPNRAA